MNWTAPHLLWLFFPCLALLWWWQRRSSHPMPPARRRVLFLVRAAAVALLLLALAGPAGHSRSSREAVVFVTDHSASQGAAGLRQAAQIITRLSSSLPRGAVAGVVSTGGHARAQKLPFTPDPALPAQDGAATDLAAGLALARGLFPAGTTPRLVLLSDGLETRGDLETAAREAALVGVRLDTIPIAGERRADVRVVELRPSRTRLHEGAPVELTAPVESSFTGDGVARLFENGIVVETQKLHLEAGRPQTLLFRRTPEQRNLYRYRLQLEGFAEDRVPENNDALALVEVRGRPLLLYVEGEEGEAHFLAEAMAREGLRLQVRPPQALPDSLQELNGYDAIILSDVSAHLLSQKTMSLLRDYVEKLGGGLLMIGGINSFGVGGYYRTPIEELLPVRIRAPDEEERQSVALAMVIDRSGSMSGEKLELCKSAATATVELLGKQDYVTVIAFDSEAHLVVPMTRRADSAAIVGQIATISAGGGTNIMPGMQTARQGLAGVRAKVKHMIVLTDGQSEGSGYESFSAQLKTEGVTVSTVALGSDADVQLLQGMAAAGGGQCYANVDPSAITRIFTQDAMKHMGRLVREESFSPRAVERHAMLRDWDATQAPQLLGYVKTTRKATAQYPLVTDLNDPLLAHWRFGLGKVTAFTSDCKSRWASLWISGWPGYSQFWGQVLRETARDAQSQEMDLHLETRGDQAHLTVEMLEDAAHFRNDATVEAEISFLPGGAVGSAMKTVSQQRLEQEASGRYAGHFTLGEPGVYLVRARSGGQMVSGGLVRNVSTETATGQVNTTLLEQAARLTGGELLPPDVTRLPPATPLGSQIVEYTPWLLRLLLMVFTVDIALRRWENLQSLKKWLLALRPPSHEKRSGSS